MKRLELNADFSQEASPHVCLESSGKCTIEGESYMENANKFYDKILDWIKNYTLKPNKTIEFNFEITYFNTSSSRFLLDILDLLSDYTSKGNIIVKWFFVKGDLNMKEEVEDYMKDSNLEIELIEFESKI